MNYYSRLFRSNKHLAQQLQFIGAYILAAGSALWLLRSLEAINARFFQMFLIFIGWLTWTFVEYIAHRFWMHGPGSGELFNHIHHHSHPTEINVTNTQRVLLVGSCMALQFTAYRLQNYFTLFSGFYAGFTGYFFVHTLLHKKWFGKICPRLQRFHILHHCKLPHHCFGVTVHWWDYVFNTTPPKKVNPSPRIVQFYFSGRKQAIVLILFTCLLSSCTHYYYAPNTSNIPLLKEKNDGKLNFNWYGTDESTGMEFKGAFAAGKNFGLMLNFLSIAKDWNFLGIDYPEENTGKGNYVEVGAGYFSTLPPSNWVFETYAGIGTGSSYNIHEYTETSKVGITKLFLQPSFGYADRNFEIDFSARLAYVLLKVKNSTVTTSHNPDDYYDIEYIRNNRSGLLIEPGLVVRAGVRAIKFSLNVTRSYNLNRAWRQEDAALAIGCTIPFHIFSGDN